MQRFDLLNLIDAPLSMTHPSFHSVDIQKFKSTTSCSDVRRIPASVHGASKHPRDCNNLRRWVSHRKKGATLKFKRSKRCIQLFSQLRNQNPYQNLTRLISNRTQIDQVMRILELMQDRRKFS